MIKFFSSVRFALKGISHLVRSERNFQIHIVVLSIVCGLGVFFSIEQMEWIAVFLISALVLLAEGLNTAFEKLCDHLHPEIHYNIRKIKDIAAGSVLLTSIFALIIGVLIFLPKILDLIGIKF